MTPVGQPADCIAASLMPAKRDRGTTHKPRRIAVLKQTLRVSGTSLVGLLGRCLAISRAAAESYLRKVRRSLCAFTQGSRQKYKACGSYIQFDFA